MSDPRADRVRKRLLEFIGCSVVVIEKVLERVFTEQGLFESNYNVKETSVRERWTAVREAAD